jgi:DHA2 family multidrug resistance protein
VVIQLQKVVPGKYIIATGFTVLAGSMFYSTRLTPDISFNQLMIMRIAQSAGLAFLFAPLSATAFANIAKRDNGDASALFTMCRNVSGSIGISLTTAQITQHTQIHMAYLNAHLNPLDQGYDVHRMQLQSALMAAGGRASTTVTQTVQTLLWVADQTQAAILAYSDLFMIAGTAALCVLPICFLLTSKIGGGANAAH